MSEVLDALKSHLERLEAKVDKLSDNLTRMVRLEEQMLMVSKRTEKQQAEFSAFEKRLNKIEASIGLNGQTLRFAERIFWIIAAAGVAWAFKA